MARKQLEKYLNQLAVKKEEFLEKQVKEYRFARFKQSLDILNKASNHQTIPTEIISKIELIFRLMPSHELYYIKKDEAQFTEYIKEVNSLFIQVLDDYEKYAENSNYFFNTLSNILYPILFIFVLYHEKLEQQFGLAFTILLSILMTSALIYINRRKLWHRYFKFE